MEGVQGLHERHHRLLRVGPDLHDPGAQPVVVAELGGGERGHVRLGRKAGGKVGIRGKTDERAQFTVSQGP